MFAVVIFTVVYVVLQPFLAVQLRRYGAGALGAVALIATLVSLIVTDVFSDGLSITGVLGWILAPLVVWLGFGLLALSRQPALFCIGLTSGVGILMCLVLALATGALVGRPRN